MGFDVSWIAFKGIDKASVLEMVGGVDTGIADEVHESPFSGAEVPGGWFILLANDCCFVSDELLGSLSAKASVVACQLHEGVMYSAAYGYEQSVQKWAVVHDAQEGLSDLSVSGSPPPAFEAVREQLTNEQSRAGGEASNVDFFFDIPIGTAEALCGYRHDRLSFDWGEPTFTTIEMPTPGPMGA